MTAMVFDTAMGEQSPLCHRTKSVRYVTAGMEITMINLRA